MMVHPDNWDAVQLYLACQTQWRIGGMKGVATGLDYAAVDVVMRRRGFRDEVFEQLQTIEKTMLSWWREHSQD